MTYSFNNNFFGYDKDNRNKLFYHGIDDPAAFNKNKEKLGPSWYYYDRQITYNRNSLGHREKEIDQLKNHSHGTAGSDIPDPTKHKYISFAKSAVRIAAGIALVWPGSLVLAGLFLIVAEVLGIAEEMV